MDEGEDVPRGGPTRRCGGRSADRREDADGEIVGCSSPASSLSRTPSPTISATAATQRRLYAATVGEVDGVRLLDPDSVRDALVVRSEGRPFVGPDTGSGWGTGFMTSSTHRPMIGPGSFGHGGLGGCLGFAHPESEIAFAYQTAQPGGLPDDRADALSRALRACL
ncbi:serine hydrolase [Streptomyces akebiae]|uniref:Serine hydrolase n=1 Tax=Streptomyces akebiae TaxID=2865673 RepID=A0ABX8Y347_9ACTN|nr:serine hydrolase [Streptomyces akebiae]